MKPSLLWTLGAVLVDSLISLVGAFALALRPETLRKLLGSLAGFGAGTMLGAAFLDLLPEAFREYCRAIRPLAEGLHQHRRDEGGGPLLEKGEL